MPRSPAELRAAVEDALRPLLANGGLVTDEDGRVVGRSGLLRPFEQDNSYSFVFDEPGRYHVMCAMHSWSTGGVTDIEQLLETTIEPGPSSATLPVSSTYPRLAV